MERLLRRALRLKPGQHRLNAQVILLVQHDGHRFVIRNQRRARFRLREQIKADQPLFA